MFFTHKLTDMKIEELKEVIYNKDYNNDLYLNLYGKIYTEILISTPYDRLEKYLSSKKRSGEKVIKDLFGVLSKHYEAERKNAVENNKEKSEECMIFETLNKKLNDKSFNAHGMSVEGMHRLLRHAYNEVHAEETVKEYKTFSGYSLHDDPLDKSVSFINTCIANLAHQDKALRGSSDAYKEIQKELKELSELRTKMIFMDDPKGYKQYFATMMRVIADKADKYVADRSMTELKHSINGYKGRRINAMREVATTLKQSMAEIQADIDKTAVSPAEKTACSKLLQKKAKEITFNDRIYAEIKAIQTGEKVEDIIKTPALKAMNKGLKGVKISAAKMNQIEIKAIEDYKKYSTAVNGVTDAGLLKNTRTKFNKILSGYAGGENFGFLDNMVFEEKKPKFITGDNNMDAVMTALRLDCIETKLTEMSAMPSKKDVYQRYASEEERIAVEGVAKADKNEVKADKNAAKAGMDEAVMGI